MSHDVFISHSHEDKPVADAVCAALENATVRCWIAPRDIIPGSEWGEAIITAITNSRLMVVIFSAKANASKQVLREVERCVSRGIILVPFRVEDVSPTGSMEYFLGTPHWLDAMSPPMEQHVARLVQTVNRILDVNASKPPTLRIPSLEPQPPRAVPKAAVPKPRVAKAPQASASHVEPPIIETPLASVPTPVVPAPPLGPRATWFENWRIGIGAVSCLLGYSLFQSRDGEAGVFYVVLGVVLLLWRVVQPHPETSQLTWPRRLVIPGGVSLAIAAVIAGSGFGTSDWQYTAVGGVALVVWGLIMLGKS